MKWCFLSALVVFFILASSFSALAQLGRYDNAVAAEVMRGTVSAQAAGAMRDNQQLILDYQRVAIEQQIAQEAVQRGLAERLDVQHALQEARRQILVQAVREDIARRLPPPSEEEVRAAYEQDPDRWSIPEAYLMDAFALDPSDSKTLRAARKLETGKPVDPEKLQRLNTTALVSQQNGQWLTTRDVAPEIWDSLPEMKEGEVRVFEVNSAIILIRRGIHREARVLPFEQIRGDIQLDLRSQRIDAAWNEYQVRKRKELGF